MASSLISLRGKYYKAPNKLAKLAEPFKSRAIFFGLMDGEVFAQDIVNGNNLGPQAGTPAPSITPWGRSLFFDGSTSHLKTARNIANLAAFTVFAWVRPKALNTYYTRIAETDYASGFFLGANTASRYAWIINNAALEGCIGGQQVIGQRDFLCGTFDGTNRLLYINGVLAGTSTATAPTAVLPLQVGRIPGSTIWNGDIDTIGIFSFTFDAKTVKQIYTDPWRIFEQPKRFLGYSFTSGSGTTGTLATTNANDTVAASGSPVVTGTLARTNANDGVTASGTTYISGALSSTNRNDTVSAYGTLPVSGTLARTNANDTVSASGSPVDTGSLARTNANDSISAFGAVGSVVAGSLAYTNANDSVSAYGTTTIKGTLARTNANDTASGAGTTYIVGTLARTNANDSIAASGSPIVSGTLARTNANDTVAASGTVTPPVIYGTLAYTNRNDTVSAFGKLTILGSLAQTNRNDSVSAFGTLTILGSLAQTNRNDSVSAYGVINNGIVFEAALMTGALPDTGIKKPGVPDGTDDWLKTTIEIFAGRRGNAIPIPAYQSLTFSSTPTQAECQALFAYTNTVQDALSQLITRFDS